MKKKIFALIILTVAVLTLCACSDSDGYSDLNKMSALSYGEIKIEVKTSYDGETLKDVYEVNNDGSKSVVNYSIERLSEVSLSGVGEYKTVKTGTFTVENGKITGTEVTDFEAAAYSGFNFNKEYFTDVILSDGKFEASVKSPAEFMGKPVLICSNMKVNVTYGEALESAIITYTSEKGAEIEISYTFVQA